MVEDVRSPALEWRARLVRDVSHPAHRLHLPIAILLDESIDNCS